MAELKIRRDRTPVVQRCLAEAETDARVARRLLAIANALGGMGRGEAARSAGMDRQMLRSFVGRLRMWNSPLLLKIMPAAGKLWL